MGGASFPTHVKLSPPSNKPIDTLIINGAECEPFLTADHRLMLERTEDLLTGILILRKILGVKECFLGIETNKPDAIQAISSALSNQKFKDITLARLKVKYPQGGEKQLINAITQREVPSGGLPMDAGCVVQNVGTAVAVFDSVVKGIPLVERVVTVTGPAVKKPGNFLVRVGTPLRLLLESCETDFTAARKVIMGGPMMGNTQSDLDAPVIKSTSGLLALDCVQAAVREYPCINCGHCVHACPVHLVPSRLAKFIEKENIDEAVEWNLMDCMECGSCTFVCPSKINIVHFIRLGKFHVQARRAANAQKK
jgi:electron transport complex protein RnfC